MKERFKSFTNRDCEFFPCHAGADPEDFNCLFCYCPLYALDGDCGGKFSYTEGGIKDCSACLVPHGEDGWRYVTGKFPRIAELMKRNRGDGR